MSPLNILTICLLLTAQFASCTALSHQTSSTTKERANGSSQVVTLARLFEGDETLKPVVADGIEQTNYTKGYDASYVKIAYPNGDVPRETGVCSDVVVRAFRAGGVDLQKELHEDMARAFAEYPQRWNLKQPDANIDHRRVPNLMTYFKRQGKALPMTQNADDYKPGDVVAWNLGGGQTHIGMVTNLQSTANERFLIVHNIGAGAQIEDVLFAWKMIGHYRYF
ncbi:MAG: hypothetical protein NVSMB56_04610 [Pyrinomonadaceae bacterium]